MTPLQIDIMLHYFCRADDWRDGDHSAPAVKDAFRWFFEQGLITHAGFEIERFPDGRLKARYALTERGNAYVTALQAVPLPVQVWIVPAQPEQQSAAQAHC